MPTDLNEHPAKPEQRDENFGEGQGDPARRPAIHPERALVR
jgi:hypothetical protein